MTTPVPQQDPRLHVTAEVIASLIGDVPEWHGDPAQDPRRHLCTLFQVWLDLQAVAICGRPTAIEDWVRIHGADMTAKFIPLRDALLADIGLGATSSVAPAPAPAPVAPAPASVPAPATPIPAMPLVVDGQVSLR